MDQYYRNRLIDLISNNLESKDLKKTAKEIQKLFNEINIIKEKTQFMKNLLIDLIDKDPNHGKVEKSFFSRIL